MGKASKKQDRTLAALLVAHFPWERLSADDAQYWIEHKEDLPDILFDALHSAVSSARDGSFQALLTACHQDRVHENITEENFPLVDDGTGSKEILEYSLGHAVTGYEAADELKRQGFKLVGMRRAMEYVAAHPDVQKDHPLIVLGAQWRHNSDDVRAPYFSWDGVRRFFTLPWFWDKFLTNCRFLVVRDKEEGEPKKHIINTSANPFLPEGWMVEEHQRKGQMEWDPVKVSLYLSQRQQNGRTIGGHELRTELKSQPVLNANVLDYLLAHPELIPESWKGKNVYFWGTIYRSPGTYLYVRNLYWDDGRWRWSYDQLVNGWLGSRPAAVSIA